MSNISASTLSADAQLPPGADEELAGPPHAMAPVSRAERISSMDVLRGFALLGILMVNIDDFSGPEALHDIPVGIGKPAFVGPHAHLNLIVLLLKWAFIENKMRGLFSVLFGAGVILFTRRKERGGAEKSADMFHRRNMWLVVLGFLHGTLIWGGDILLMYGMNALLVLYPLRNLRPKTLLTVGTILWAGVYTFAWMHYTHSFDLPALARREAVVAAHQRAGRQLTAEEKKTQEEWSVVTSPGYKWEGPHDPVKIDANKAQEEIKKGTQGYFAFVRDEGSGFFSQTFRIVALGASLDTLGAMLVGMALFKYGFLSAELPFNTYLWTAVIGYLISIPISVLTILKAYSAGFSVLAMNEWIYPTAFISTEAGVLAIAATLLMLCKSGAFRLLLRPFAAVGQTALSNYLLTSILCELVFRFGPWKLYGQLEYYQAVFVVFAVWAINLTVSPLWLRAFEFGPCEWLWRSLTYWRLQPMRIRSDDGGKFTVAAAQQA